MAINSLVKRSDRETGKASEGSGPFRVRPPDIQASALTLCSRHSTPPCLTHQGLRLQFLGVFLPSLSINLIVSQS